MTCSACRGMMLKQHTYDFVQRDGRACLGDWRWVWCCIACERVVDAEREPAASHTSVTDQRQGPRASRVSMHDELKQAA